MAKDNNKLFGQIVGGIVALACIIALGVAYSRGAFGVTACVPKDEVVKYLSDEHGEALVASGVLALLDGAPARFEVYASPAQTFSVIISLADAASTGGIPGVAMACMTASGTEFKIEVQKPESK